MLRDYVITITRLIVPTLLRACKKQRILTYHEMRILDECHLLDNADASDCTLHHCIYYAYDEMLRLLPHIEPSLGIATKNGRNRHDVNSRVGE